MNKAKLDELCVNTIRMLAAEGVEKAKSGHPGMPMGAASMAYALWTNFLKHNPKNPGWWDRDRFVLSGGHGSMLLYSLLHLAGYDLPLEELKNFRQWGSKAPGHPEHGHTPGVETTTGPLGQGFANAVGMAIAERHLASTFNKPELPIVDHYTYVMVGDGDLMEGLSHEAASLAGHLKLGRLICLYDDNHICIEGSTDLAFTEDRAARFRAYGWDVRIVEDGNDLLAITAAIREAREDVMHPSIIMVRTRIGFGSPNKENKASAHGEPLGKDELALTKQRLGWPLEPAFYIPEEALRIFRTAIGRGATAEQEWTELFQSYQMKYPELATQYRDWMEGRLPADWDSAAAAVPADAKGTATRAASGTVLNQIAAKVGNLLGGSADLAPSTKTLLKGIGDFGADNYGGRNFHFGVRELGMGGILNGMALHGGLIPYGATFLVFADYMRPAIRLAALMRQHVIYVFTHDSIGLGEDGPTHQPIEHLASLRCIPGLTVLRPGDANETVEAWKCAVEADGPVALILTRQNVPVLDRTVYAAAEGLKRGGYVVKASANPEAVLIGTGSEVSIALQAAQQLELDGLAVQVVSMPSWELFGVQPNSYQASVLPEGVLMVAVEAASTFGWNRYADEVIGIDHFGASAPYETLYEEFGVTADHVVAVVKARLAK